MNGERNLHLNSNVVFLCIAKSSYIHKLEYTLWLKPWFPVHKNYTLSSSPVPLRTFSFLETVSPPGLGLQPSCLPKKLSVISPFSAFSCPSWLHPINILTFSYLYIVKKRHPCKYSLPSSLFHVLSKRTNELPPHHLPVLITPVHLPHLVHLLPHHTIKAILSAIPGTCMLLNPMGWFQFSNS